MHSKHYRDLYRSMPKEDAGYKRIAITSDTHERRWACHNLDKPLILRWRKNPKITSGTKMNDTPVAAATEPEPCRKDLN